MDPLVRQKELSRVFSEDDSRPRKKRRTKTHNGSNATYTTSMRTTKPDLIGDKPRDQEQLAGYAIEMFSARGVRRHVLGLFIDSLSVEFWYYNRSAGYGSVPQSFGENWESLAILLLAIGNASAEDLGFQPHIMPPRNVESGLGSSMLTSSDGARIMVDGEEYEVQGEKLGKLRSLTGRGEPSEFNVQSGNFPSCRYHRFQSQRCQWHNAIVGLS